MPYQVEKKEKLATVQKIVQSKHFQDSEILKELLTYLVDMALDNITPKEITIAQELYKNKSFDPSVDSYVRSNVYKLRKRLQNYYEKEGAQEKLRLVIPKGSYHVEFEKREVKKPTKFNYLIVPVVLLTLITIILAWLLFSEQKNMSERIYMHDFWKDINNNKKPVCFAISDIVMYSEFDKGLNRERWILDTKVFTKNDVDTLIQAEPQRDIAPLEFSFVHMSNVPNFMQIAPIFAQTENENYFKWSSEVTWKDITQNNIVYIGDIRSLHKLGILFNHLHIKVKAPFTFSWIGDDGDTLGVYDFERKEEYRETYSAIIKLPGPSGNTILLLIGNDYPARIFTVDKFTEIHYLNNFYEEYEKQFKHNPEYFELILKVRGFKRTGYNSEILFMNSIDPDSFSWNF